MEKFKSVCGGLEVGVESTKALNTTRVMPCKERFMQSTEESLMSHEKSALTFWLGRELCRLLSAH